MHIAFISRSLLPLILQRIGLAPDYRRGDKPVPPSKPSRMLVAYALFAVRFAATPCAGEPKSELDKFLAYAEQIASENYSQVVDISARASEVFKAGQEITPWEQELVSRRYSRSILSDRGRTFYYFTKWNRWGFSITKRSFERQLRLSLYTENGRTISKVSAYLAQRPSL